MIWFLAGMATTLLLEVGVMALFFWWCIREARRYSAERRAKLSKLADALAIRHVAGRSDAEIADNLIRGLS